VACCVWGNRFWVGNNSKILYRGISTRFKIGFLAIVVKKVIMGEPSIGECSYFDLLTFFMCYANCGRFIGENVSFMASLHGMILVDFEVIASW